MIFLDAIIMNNPYTAQYHPPRFLFNGHLQTVFPSLLRKVMLPIPYQRERIETSDEDFLDLNWLKDDHERVVIITHGLEGDANRTYVKGMARAVFNAGFDVVAWNFRGCSEEINLQPRMYHSGATADLLQVISHVKASYQSIYLIGFSLGANLTLKLTGENEYPENVKKVCVFSVPLDLRSGAINLSAQKNFLYERRFMKSLKKKAEAKHLQFPGIFDISKLDGLKHIYDFDEHVTAPVHGFKGADDYYEKCSSKYFLDRIAIPTSIVNAANDPFLTPEILDNTLGQSNPFVDYLITKSGGHCGFPSIGQTNYWSEQLAVDFFLTK